jgi:hypothetical protein
MWMLGELRSPISSDISHNSAIGYLNGCGISFTRSKYDWDDP